VNSPRNSLDWEPGVRRIAKARQWWAFLRLWGAVSRTTGLLDWSERIRTHAFSIEPGLCVSFLKFGNIRSATARQKRFKPQKQRVKRCSRIILRSALTMEQARRSERPG